jgi:hypothetical protein
LPTRSGTFSTRAADALEGVAGKVDRGGALLAECRAVLDDRYR